MYGCKNWTIKKVEHLKNWLFPTVVLEKTLENPLEWKEIKPVNPKGNQSWIFTGRTDAEAETPILWPPGKKNWVVGKDPDAGKDWRREEKGTTEDEMVGWHYWLDGHEFELALGVDDGQGSLACCSPWGRKQSDTTQRLNWTELPSRLAGLISLQSTGLSRVLLLSVWLISLSIIFPRFTHVAAWIKVKWGLVQWKLNEILYLNAKFQLCGI